MAKSPGTDTGGGMIPVAALAELQAKGRLVVQGAQCPLLVLYERGKVFALDNRCPHLGFPLHRGSVDDGILTCHWHHARFDIASGGTFDPWADDVPTAAVAVRDGRVWIGREMRHPDGPGHWRNRLRDGLEQNIGLVIAKAVFGLIRDGIAPGDIVREAVLFGARSREGWGAGLTILTAFTNLLPLLPADEAGLALFQGVSAVARDCDGAAPRRGRQPLAEAHDPAMLRRWLRHWIGVRHAEGAERTLLTAIAGGMPPAGLAALLLIAATDRSYADAGHPPDFINKAFECLDGIGWEHAAAILPTVTGDLAAARGGEESNAWRHPVDLVALCEAAFAGLPAWIAAGATLRGQWRSHAALAEAMLADGPEPIVAALGAAIGAGAGPDDLSRALAYAAALRLVRFGTANDLSDWETAHHVFTHANALDGLIRRAVPSVTAAEPALWRGIFHGAMAVYLIRFLNVPPARLPDPAAMTDLPTGAETLLTALLDAFDRQGQVATVTRLVARYFALGHPAQPLITTLARAVLREDADFHTCQMLEAGVRQFTAWGAGPEGQRILLAVARYLAAHFPTRRTRYQTVTVARRLSRGQELHEEEGDGEAT